MTEPLRREVPTEHIAEVEAKVAKLAKRCVRLGVEPPVLTIGEPRLVPDPYADPVLDPRPCIEVADLTLTAPESIGLSGWSLLGRVDALPDGTPLVARTPGTEALPLPVVTDAKLCVHCGLRRTRTETFLVAHTDGRTAQVGRNCLRDFLGHDPAALLFWAQALDDFDGYLGGLRGENLDSTADLLKLASRVAAHGGYLGVTKARAINEERAARDEPGVTSTVERINEYLDFPYQLAHARGWSDRFYIEERKRKWEADFPLDELAQSLYDATVEAAAAVTPADGEWANNVKAILGQKALRARHRNIAVSGVVLGLKALDIAKRAKAPAETVESQYVGEPGKRLDIDATVAFTRHFDSDYGPRTLVRYRSDEPGADLIWWASGFIEPEVGEKVHIRGTVKAHEVDKYTNRATTVLTRVAMAAR